VYFEQGKYDEALAEIDTTLERNSLDAYSYLVRGKIYVELNNESKALEAFNQYFQLQKLSFYEARGYAEIGFTYEHFGDDAAAATYLNQAAALHGDIGTLYLSIAQGYRARSNYPMALENLNRAIRLHTPELAAAYAERAAVYIGLQADSMALKDCDSIIQLRPQKPEGYQCKGAVLIDLRKIDQALNNFNHALDLDSTFMAAYSGRAIAEIYQQNYDLALADLNVAIKADGLVSNNYRLRALVYTALNNVSAAIVDYEMYLRLAGGAAIHPEIVENMRQLREQMGNA
jgi:tetratricopeptide (TPR) repeat protein